MISKRQIYRRAKARAKKLQQALHNSLHNSNNNYANSCIPFSTVSTINKETINFKEINCSTDILSNDGIQSSLVNKGSMLPSIDSKTSTDVNDSLTEMPVNHVNINTVVDVCNSVENSELSNYLNDTLSCYNFQNDCITSNSLFPSNDSPSIDTNDSLTKEPATSLNVKDNDVNIFENLSGAQTYCKNAVFRKNMFISDLRAWWLNIIKHQIQYQNYFIFYNLISPFYLLTFVR